MTTKDQDDLIRVEDPAVRALLPNYLERRRQDVHSIKRLLEAGDFDQIAVLAHRMRGSGSAYGADFVTRLGAEMEAGASSGNSTVIAAAVAQLDALLAQVKLE